MRKDDDRLQVFNEGRPLECLRCGHGSDLEKPWYARKPERPRVCPDCKHPWWDRPRGE